MVVGGTWGRYGSSIAVCCVGGGLVGGNGVNELTGRELYVIGPCVYISHTCENCGR